ncbi:MAG TPA: hypothetical protein P5159_20720 [Phycisphaerae bacterium]|nr:hypothetical protein [Phycisphaerae bacterium]
MKYLLDDTNTGEFSRVPDARIEDWSAIGRPMPAKQGGRSKE